MDDGAASEVKPACRALVPVVAPTQWSQVPHHLLSRSDVGFVAHLIATAEHLPQTRSLRRATPADARSAYGAHRNQLPGVGIWTRQTI